MKRKYDKRNKLNFVLILLLSIAVICIFSLFIYKYVSASKIYYEIEASSLVQDTLKNYINISEDAILKKRWNDKYYIEYQGEKINLGKKVIVYNTITGSLKLYGTFYEITEEGKVIDHNNETILDNTTDSKFYKIEDREYLVVDSKIFSDDRKIEANSYLLVELDKLGNAKLSNHKINLKTITPTTLVTSKYTFDINNEILNFGKYDINLKKIIGSTNQYEPEEEEEPLGGGGTGTGDGNGTGTGTGTGTGNGTGTGTGTGNGTGTGDGTGEGAGGDGTGIGTGGTGDGVINNGSGSGLGPDTDIEDVIEKLKMTSIIRIVEGLNQIDVDYVIYDPYNEYKSVYVEVVGNDKVQTTYLSRNDTHITLNNLVANTDYILNFIYTAADPETGELVPTTFDSYELKTLMPEYSVSVYKVSKVSNTLTYKVNLDPNYSIDSVTVLMEFEYEDIDPETEEKVIKKVSDKDTVSVDSKDKYILGKFDVSNYLVDKDTLVRLTVVSVNSGELSLPVKSSYTFRFGR